MRVGVNGRFRAQPLTGVQRYAAEVVRALEAETKVRGLPSIEVYVPFGRRWASGLAGHLWDQAIFPLRAGNALLLGLGNLGPVWVRRQIVVVHDAAIYDVPEGYRAAYRAAHRLVQRGLVARGARLATVSAFSRERLAAVLRIPLERIAVTGVGSDHIDRTAAEPQILEELGLARGRYVLAVAGRAAHKNLVVLERIAAPLADRGLRLVLVGAAAGPFTDLGRPLRGLVASGPLRDGELRALYEHALALVFPSIYEGFGLPTLEAMRLGCPVLIARARPLLEHCGDAALSFSPDDVGGLLERVDRLRLDDALRVELVSRGRRTAAGWRWSDVAGRILDLLVECGASETARTARPPSLSRPEADLHG